MKKFLKKTAHFPPLAMLHFGGAVESAFARINIPAGERG